jgi:hypothetical protein
MDSIRTCGRDVTQCVIKPIHRTRCGSQLTARDCKCSCSNSIGGGWFAFGNWGGPSWSWKRGVYFQRGRLPSVLFIVAGQTVRRIEQRWFSGHLANRGGFGMSSGFVTVTFTLSIPYIVVY